MVIFQYNLYIFGIHLWTVLYPKLCYNEPCYKEVVVYAVLFRTKPLAMYLYSNNQRQIDKMLDSCTSGSVCVNDCIMQSSGLSLYIIHLQIVFVKCMCLWWVFSFNIVHKSFHSSVSMEFCFLLHTMYRRVYLISHSHTCHKLLAEICEIRLIFRWDLTEFCEIFIRITFKLTGISLKPLFW